MVAATDKGGDLSGGGDGWQIGDIGEALIHGDAPQNRAEVSLNKDTPPIAESGRQAVRVASGKDSNAARATQSTGHSIGEGGLRGERFDQAHATMEREDWFCLDPLQWALGAGGDTKLQQTDADGVKGASGMKGVDAGAVVSVKQDMGANLRREQRQDVEKAIPLEGGEVLVGVGGGEVGAQSFEDEAWFGENGFQERGGLWIPDPEAAHAGINFQVDCDGLPELGGDA